MRVGVLTRGEEPFSARLYRENLEAVWLGGEGGPVEPLPFAPQGPLPPGCDLVWDPALGMGRVPGILYRPGAPRVVTVHGLRAFSLPVSELASGVGGRARMAVARFRRAREWRRFAGRPARLIAVSEFGAGELAAAFGIARGRIRAIHHGIAHAIFRTEGQVVRRARPYFLHVSSYQPKKNLGRVLEAHARLPARERPDLVLVTPGYPGSLAGRPGVELVDRGLSPPELAAWYRGALALVFPSLHETFGMPIAEAMACGCPVLTANQTACPEVAGEAALLVDPRSLDALAGALAALAADAGLRAALRERGLARARLFDWRTCARRHVEVFDEALRSGA